MSGIIIIAGHKDGIFCEGLMSERDTDDAIREFKSRYQNTIKSANGDVELHALKIREFIDNNIRSLTLKEFASVHVFMAIKYKYKTQFDVKLFTMQEDSVPLNWDDIKIKELGKGCRMVCLTQDIRKAINCYYAEQVGLPEEYIRFPPLRLVDLSQWACDTEDCNLIDNLGEFVSDCEKPVRRKWLTHYGIDYNDYSKA